MLLNTLLIIFIDILVILENLISHNGKLWNVTRAFLLCLGFCKRGIKAQDSIDFDIIIRILILL